MTEEQKAEIQRLNDELDTELTIWRNVLDTEPHLVTSTNIFVLDSYVKALSQFLIEKEIIDEGEFIIFFKKALLNEIKEWREKVGPMIQRAKLEAAGVEFPNLAIPKERKH